MSFFTAIKLREKKLRPKRENLKCCRLGLIGPTLTDIKIATVHFQAIDTVSAKRKCVHSVKNKGSNA
jgi:hypothetical protein